jgi:16S rRNA (cytosine1407-C5)-methyltransferase
MSAAKGAAKGAATGPNQAFEDHYQKIWGERWTSLRESLLLPAASIPYDEGLIKPYMMDRASVLAACSLRLPSAECPEGIILDACAAPGGKSLVLASRMAANSRLLSNELSGERRRRLVKTLDEHLDGEKRQRVTVSGFDAGELGGRRSEWDRFDAILLDAPCSSERHVIQSAKALAEWTPARPRFLSRRQWALLSAAFLLLKPGGSLVYATCALSPEENDGPVSRLLSKYADKIELDEPDFPEGEKTAYGKLILPDLSTGADAPLGMGPMYVARFRKTPL